MTLYSTDKPVGSCVTTIMAVIRQGSNELVGKTRKYKIMSIILFILTILFLFSFLIPLFLIVGIICNITIRKWMSYKSGLQGEKQTLESLKDLPDEYTIFTNAKIHDGMEADAIVVGSNGVFVIETKNYKGQVEGNERSKIWILHKTGREGSKYTKQIPNPLAQLRKNIFIVSKYLKIKKSPAWVEGCVVFPNEETAFLMAVGNTQKDIDIFSKMCKKPYMLKSYILDYTPKRKLDSRQIENICNCLSECLEKPAMTRNEFEVFVEAIKSESSNRIEK